MLRWLELECNCVHWGWAQPERGAEEGLSGLIGYPPLASQPPTFNTNKQNENQDSNIRLRGVHFGVGVHVISVHFNITSCTFASHTHFYPLHSQHIYFDWPQKWSSSASELQDGRDLRVLFSCIRHHCMNRVMVSLKIVSLFICLEKSPPEQVLFATHANIRSIFGELKITNHPLRSV